jgi:hypothetical protein
MNPVRFLGDALRTATGSVAYLWRTQGTERRQLIADLQAICSRCEDAYAAVLKQLQPVKNSYGNRKALVKAMRMFAADDKTRSAFKPEHLCGEVDQLLQRLTSNVDWLKYSVDLREIERLRGAIARMGSYDGQLRDYYDDHTRAMDDIATQLQSKLPNKDAKERQAYARHVIEEFETDLRDTLKKIQKAKKQIRELI